METLSFRTTNNNPLSELDLGDAPAGSSDDYSLRLHNVSDNYQAEDVVVTAVGGEAIQLWLSLDDEVFTDSISLGDIAPGSASEVFWLRRVTPASAPEGEYTAALRAQPAGWSTPIDTTASGNIALETGD